MNWQVWSERCVIGWGIWCEHFLKEFKEETWSMRKPQPTPFAIRMVDQWKVQVIWFDLKFENQLIGKLNYKILITMLNMENKIEAYFMFLGRSWMKQAKVHDNWGKNIFTITSTNIMITLSIIKCVNVKSSFQWPRNLDIEFD